ncbi:Woronin body major protein [Pleurostoma richardsiae]|uniref:Woronin body major protein n=1 Tax=Pleurostoma richardsiae TaxID=41990 RepID=A0AA38VJE3_9PEZI|nr:Woronin body major protein [Pleurostoma richardsiae]
MCQKSLQLDISIVRISSQWEAGTIVVTLDFEARVPVPFSIFPSSYREADSATTTTTQTHEEVEFNLPPKQAAGREGQYSSYAAQANLPPRGDRYSEEEVRITREEEHYRRPGTRQDRYREDRRPYSTYSDTRVEVDTTHRPYSSQIDNIEREYRSRVQPSYREEIHVGSTVDPPSHRPVYEETVRVDQSTVDPPRGLPSYHQDTHITEETVEVPRYNTYQQKSKMGYYDEDGHYHSFRHGVHKMADRILHPEGRESVEVTEIRETRGSRSSVSSSSDSYVPNTVTIPCHHIRLGDILMLQGRPCMVIRISTSAATGQHRYLGVDLFTKQLHEESSFVSNPAPSVVVQTMLGPVLKQYRVLDLQDGTVVAMTETGDVKQNLPVIDQSNLWSRLQNAFETGRGSVRVLVVNDHGRELAVDMKVIHGARL